MMQEVFELSVHAFSAKSACARHNLSQGDHKLCPLKSIEVPEQILYGSNLVTSTDTAGSKKGPSRFIVAWICIRDPRRHKI